MMSQTCRTSAAVALAPAGLPRTAPAQGIPAPDGATVQFADLQNGATAGTPVSVVFGLSDLGVALAGVERDAHGTTTCQWPARLRANVRPAWESPTWRRSGMRTTAKSAVARVKLR